MSDKWTKDEWSGSPDSKDNRTPEAASETTQQLRNEFFGEEKKEEEKRKLMDERVREEVQKMLRENGAEHADRESGSEKQVNDEEISDKTQK